VLQSYELILKYFFGKKIIQQILGSLKLFLFLIYYSTMICPVKNFEF
jgi:hypothetical protein